MIKGDKIKLVKQMGAFTNVGEICDVIDVTEGGVISFRFGPGKMHLGCMSYDEYLKYFELVEEKKPRIWTDWRNGSIEYYDMDNERNFCTVHYRHDGKRVQIKNEGWQLKAEASCHNEDEFSLAKGLNLAKMRLIVKILDKQVKEIAKGM